MEKARMSEWSFAIAGKGATKESEFASPLVPYEVDAEFDKKADCQLVLTRDVPVISADKELYSFTDPGEAGTVPVRKVDSETAVVPVLVKGDLSGEWTASDLAGSDPVFSSTDTKTIDGQNPGEYLREHTVDTGDNMYLIKGKEGENIAVSKDSGTSTTLIVNATLYRESGEAKEAPVKETGTDGLYGIDLSGFEPGTYVAGEGTDCGIFKIEAQEKADNQK